MYLVAIAWIYVVLMMALAEALSKQGTVLGGVITFVLYGVLPLSIVLYVLGSPMRRRARRVDELAAEQVGEQKVEAARAPANPTAGSDPAPDGGRQAACGQAAGLRVAERKEV